MLTQAACQGEHGVGIGKKAFLQIELGDGPLKLMRDIKQKFDPYCLMNPGKIFDVCR